MEEEKEGNTLKKKEGKDHQNEELYVMNH